MMHADRGILRDRMAFAMVKGMRRVNADSMLGLIGSETLFLKCRKGSLQQGWAVCCRCFPTVTGLSYG